MRAASGRVPAWSSMWPWADPARSGRRLTSEASPQTAEIRTMVVGKPQRAIGHQGEFIQGSAACQTDRRRPLHQGPIGFPNGWPLQRWLVRQRVC
jgi:hypothetical protein